MLIPVGLASYSGTIGGAVSPVEEPLVVLVGGGVGSFGVAVSPWNDWNEVGHADAVAVGCAGALGPTTERIRHSGVSVAAGDGLEQNVRSAGPPTVNSLMHGVAFGSRVAVGLAVGSSVTRTRPFGLAAVAELAKTIRTAVRATRPVIARVVARRRTTSGYLHVGDRETALPINWANMGGRGPNVQQTTYISADLRNGRADPSWLSTAWAAPTGRVSHLMERAAVSPAPVRHL